MAYLTTLPVAYFIQHRKIGWYWTTDWKVESKAAVAARIPSGYLMNSSHKHHRSSQCGLECSLIIGGKLR